VLIGLHLVLVASRHHTQFRVTRRHTERTVIGIPMVPGYVPRTLGLASAVTAVLFLLGGLVQINPIWLWGPYHPYEATNGAQPDWYLGWLIGGLRLMPDWDLVIAGKTVVPNPFWGGAAFPLVVFGLLFLWPWLERRLTGDHAFHNLLDRPRDAPWRTGLAAALATWVTTVFLAGSMDRAHVTLGMPYERQIWVYRVLVWVAPIVALLVTLRICRELRDGEEVHRRRHAAERAARRSP
jgi:ubiquinol-cytochrome c reductase cytochrome b subunit